MKRIPLTQGQFALVDDEDYEKLSQYKWHARWNKTSNTFYADRHTRKSDGRRTKIQMHREIMDASPGLDVDHIDHNGLNNTKSNLRLITHRQNSYGNIRHKRGSSRFKGVNWDKQHQQWRAQIYVNKRKVNLGTFNSEIDAACAYDAAAAKHFGEYGTYNFPLPGEQPALRRAV